MQLKELEVLIKANAKQFKGEMAQVRQILNSLNSTTGQTSQAVGNLFPQFFGANIASQLFLSTISKLSDSFFGLTQDIIQNGTELSRIKVATNTVARNMGMTAEEVNNLRKELEEANTFGIYAEETIKTLAMSGLVDMSKSLRAVDARTGEYKEGVASLVLAMKDLSAGALVDSADGIERITRFIRSGNASYVDGIIEVGNMNYAYKAFADSIGKNVQQLTEQERATARMNIVMDESKKAFGAYANTMQSAGKLFDSIGHKWKQITASIGDSLSPVFDTFANGMFQLVSAIQEAVTGVSGSIRNFALQVAGVLVALFRILGRLLSRIPLVGKYFKGLAEFTMKPIKAVGSLSGATSGYADSADDASKATKDLKKELMGLAGFDEMNVLNKPTDSAGTGGGSSGGGVGDIGGIGGGGMEGLGLSEEDIATIEESAKNFEKWFNDMLGPLKELFAILGALGTAFAVFKIGSILVGLFGGALAVLSSPITWIVLGIAGVVAVLALLFTKFEEVRNLFSSVGNLINTVVTTAFQLLSAVFEWLWINILQPAVLWIQENLVPVFLEIVNKITEIVDIINREVPGIVAVLEPLGKVVGDYLKTAFQWLGEKIDWVWKNILKPLIDFVLANMVPGFEVFVKQLKDVIKVIVDVATTVLEILKPGFDLLLQVADTVFKTIASVVSWFWNNILKPVFTALYSFISQFVIPVLQFLWKVAEIVFNAIKRAVEIAWQKIKEAIQPVINWFNSTVMPIINTLKSKFEEAWNGIRNGAEGIWNTVKEAFRTGINSVLKQINSFIDKINDAIRTFSSASQSIGGPAINFRVGKIPYLETGGIIDSPTIAMLGESGREAVVPLENNTEWIDKLASKINQGGGSANIVVKIGDEEIYNKFIDYHNERSMATNSLLLNV